MQLTGLPIDLSNIDAETLRDLHELYREEQEQIALGEEILLRELAQDNRNRERSIDGIGGRVMSIPTSLYVQSKLQGETMEDPGYRKFIANRYDIGTPKVGGTKDIHIGYTGALTAAAWAGQPKRFSKSYG